jgi:membrane protein implicated in regulation of membrane protease activity
MPWWSWMIIGAVLLGAELLGVDAAFYLVFIGFAAALVGLVELAGAGLEAWVQWILFSIIAVVMMVLFRRKLYGMMRGSAVGYETGPAGETVTVSEALEPGHSGRLNYRGTDWTIVNDGGVTIAAGQQARIVAVDGLKLKLEPLNKE